MRKTRKELIVAGLNAGKSTEEIVASVQEAFPDVEARKVRNQISVNKSLLAKEKVKVDE